MALKQLLSTSFSVVRTAGRSARMAAAGAAALLLAACAIPRDVPNQAAAPAGVARFGELQLRLDALGASGRFKSAAGSSPAEALASYDWAKAQCWVRHAYSERHENDAAGFAAAGLGEAEKIVKGLEAGNNPYHETALVNHSTPLRPDLWKRAAQLKASAGFACAAQTTACLEVQLSRSGHELAETGWRHANSYVAIAEDMAGKAQSEADTCTAPPAPVTPAAMPPPVQTERLTIAADVLFKFDRYRAADARPEGLRKLDEVAARLKQVQLESVRVTGHTDPLGMPPYNQQLSERRASTVRQLLVQRGIDASKITATGDGETQQVKACDRKAFKTRSALVDCLQPNRRVDIELVYLQKQ